MKKMIKAGLDKVSSNLTANTVQKQVIAPEQQVEMDKSKLHLETSKQLLEGSSHLVNATWDAIQKTRQITASQFLQQRQTELEKTLASKDNILKARTPEGLEAIKTDVKAHHDMTINGLKQVGLEGLAESQAVEQARNNQAIAMNDFTRRANEHLVEQEFQNVLSHKQQAFEQDKLVGELDSSTGTVNLEKVKEEGWQFDFSNDAYTAGTFYTATANSANYTGDDQALINGFFNWHAGKAQATIGRIQDQFTALQEGGATVQQMEQLIDEGRIEEGSDKWNAYKKLYTARAIASGMGQSQAEQAASYLLEARSLEYEKFYASARNQIDKDRTELDRKTFDIRVNSERTAETRAEAAVDTPSDTMQKTGVVIVGTAKFSDEELQVVYENGDGYIQNENKAVQKKRLDDRKVAFNAVAPSNQKTYLKTKYATAMRKESVATQKLEDSNHNWIYIKNPSANGKRIQEIAAVGTLGQFKEFDLEGTTQRLYSYYSSLGNNTIPETKIPLTENNIRMLLKYKMHSTLGITDTTFAKKPEGDFDMISIMQSASSQFNREKTGFQMEFIEDSKDNTYSELVVDKDEAKLLSKASSNADTLIGLMPTMGNSLQMNGKEYRYWSNDMKDYLLKHREEVIKYTGATPEDLIKVLGETYSLSSHKRTVKKIEKQLDEASNGTMTDEDAGVLRTNIKNTTTNPTIVIPEDQKSLNTIRNENPVEVPEEEKANEIDTIQYEDPNKGDWDIDNSNLNKEKTAELEYRIDYFESIGDNKTAQQLKNSLHNNKYSAYALDAVATDKTNNLNRNLGINVEKPPVKTKEEKQEGVIHYYLNEYKKKNNGKMPDVNTFKRFISKLPEEDKKAIGDIGDAAISKILSVGTLAFGAVGAGSVAKKSVDVAKKVGQLRQAAAKAEKEMEQELKNKQYAEAIENGEEAPANFNFGEYVKGSYEKAKTAWEEAKGAFEAAEGEYAAIGGAGAMAVRAGGAGLLAAAGGVVIKMIKTTATDIIKNDNYLNNLGIKDQNMKDGILYTLKDNETFRNRSVIHKTAVIFGLKSVTEKEGTLVGSVADIPNAGVEVHDDDDTVEQKVKIAWGKLEKTKKQLKALTPKQRYYAIMKHLGVTNTLVLERGWKHTQALMNQGAEKRRTEYLNKQLELQKKAHEGMLY